MFCKKCGSELVGTEVYCEACGEPVRETGDQGRAIASQSVVSEAGLEAQAGEGGGYRSFEYARIAVEGDLAQVACDCYESLGYELTGQRASSPAGKVALSFRRSRKVRGKAQLAKMQRAMDDALASIASLEAAKTRKASIQALAIGIISALVLGVGMCCTMVWTHLMVLGIVVGIVGLVGCVFAWLRYRKVCEAEAARINPQIEEAYDHLATQCEEGQAILRATA